MFDNDGTLWTEKPMPIQLDFILRRLVQMAETDPSLRERQPWQAAYTRDYGWLARRWTSTTQATTATCRSSPVGSSRLHRDDRRGLRGHVRHVPALGRHPTLGRGYLEMRLLPMVELLGYLAANGFTNYIASGGGRDFMRPDHARRSTASRVNGSSAAAVARLGSRRPRRHAHATPQRRSTSTMAPRSRSGSGAASDAGQSSPAAIPTATSRCSSTLSTRTCHRCGCSSCTTMPSASSTTRAGRRGPGAGRAARLDRRQRQGRLGRGVRAGLGA